MTIAFATAHEWLGRLRAAAERHERLVGWLRLLLLVPIALAIYARNPSVIENPRFWAEEGTHHFTSAIIHDDWKKALLDIHNAPHAAYVRPIPQIATVIAANAVPLTQAPAVTTAAWFLVLVALELVVLFSRAELLRGPWRRLLGLSAPLVALCTTELWANTLGAHYYCDLALILLLLEAPRVADGRRRASLWAFLVFAALSPSAWMVVPAAAFLVYRDWRAHITHFLILFSTSFTHALVSLLAFTKTARPGTDLATLPHVLASKLLVWPFAGRDAADAYAEWALKLSPDALALWAAGISLVVLGLLALFFVFSRRDTTTTALLILYVTAIAAAALFGLGLTLTIAHSTRYFWLPHVLAILLLGHQLEFERLRRWAPSQLFFAAAFAAVFIVGGFEYRYAKREDAAMRGPVWRREVRRFKRDPAREKLGIAPRGWVVSIPRKVRERRGI